MAEAPAAAPRAALETARRTAARATVPRREAVRRGRAAQVVALAALAGFGLLFALVRADRTRELDLGLTIKLQRLRRPWASRLMAAASWPGFPPQSRVIPPAIISTLWLLGFRLEAACQALGWGTALLSTLAKAGVRRQRPLAPEVRVVVAPLGGTSFPSGHVLTYVGTYGFLAFLAHSLVRPPAVRLPLAGALAGLVALVGPSRIHQGHHWPTDVLASYLLGFSYLLGLSALYRRLKADPRLGRRAT